jgi:hypothetical protein
LAGLMMYLYTRYLNLDPFPATLAALTYMFSGYIVGRTQFVPMVNAAAWFPLLLLLSDRLARRRNHLDVLWLGLTLALQSLAGHAQLWFYGLWLIGPYTLFRNWQEMGRLKNPRSLASSLSYSIIRLFAAVTLAILLAAVQLLPTAEFTTQSPRSSGAEITFALTYSFWPWRLITLLAPNFFGHPATDNYWGYANFWEDHAYLGILPLLLALVAMWDYGMRKAWGKGAVSGVPEKDQPWRVVPFFAAFVPISLILAMGWNTPIYLWVFQFIPGFSFFQAPARLLIWFTVAMAVLAGIGAQYFRLTPYSRRGWQRLLVAAAGLTIAGVAGSFVLTGRSQTFLTATMMLGAWLAGSIILLLLRPRKQVPASGAMRLPPDRDQTITGASPVSKEFIWQWSVLAFVALDLLWAAWPLIPTMPAALFRQPVASGDFLNDQPGAYRYFVDEQFDYTTKFDHYLRFAGFGPNDLTYWQSLRETLIPNLGAYTGLASSNNYDPLVVGRWQHLVDLLQNADDSQRARLLALMNVGYFVSNGSHHVGPTLYADQAMVIQQVSEPLPRAYFVSQVYYAKNEAEVISRITSPDFDYHREVIIMGDKAETKAEAEEESGTVNVIIAGASRVSLTVEVPAAGFVVLTDTFYRGWQATVDGQPAQIWPANLAFRAVGVEAGTHEIVFEYRPRSFIIGLWTSIVTLSLLVITTILLKKTNSDSTPAVNSLP